MLKVLAEVADRPIVVNSETLIGKGATGGLVLSAEDLGRDAGRRISRILNGEAAASIPIASGSFNKSIFDARQLKRWDVSELALPTGRRFVSENSIFGISIAGKLVAVALVIPIQALVILLLFFEHRRRQLAERDAHHFDYK